MRQSTPKASHAIQIRSLMIVVAFMLTTVAFANAPIYIWKGERVGYHDGYYFHVSIGHSGNPTPTGRYTVKKKVVDYWSRKYKRPMPYSVFFTDAHAIHSGDLTTDSKGCVRVDRQVAMWLYSKAKTGKTKVIIRA